MGTGRGDRSDRVVGWWRSNLLTGRGSSRAYNISMYHVPVNPCAKCFVTWWHRGEAPENHTLATPTMHLVHVGPGRSPRTPARRPQSTRHPALHRPASPPPWPQPRPLPYLVHVGPELLEEEVPHRVALRPRDLQGAHVLVVLVLRVPLRALARAFELLAALGVLRTVARLALHLALQCTGVFMGVGCVGWLRGRRRSALACSVSKTKHRSETNGPKVRRARGCGR